MFVLLTTANYPDVMMPTYMENGYTVAFFIIYLFFGLFLLMNMLLAIFYAHYQENLDDVID